MRNNYDEDVKRERKRGKMGGSELWMMGTEHVA